MNPAGKAVEQTDAATRERARAFVLAHGWNATVFQILNPGIRYWFAPENRGVVGYVTRRGVRIVLGAPVCARDDLAIVTHAWEDDTRRAGERICYLGAAGRLLGLLRDGWSDRPTAVVSLGAQPIWNLANWKDGRRQNRSLRSQVRRAANKGVAVAEWATAAATDDDRLRQCLQAWLLSKPLPPLRFLVEPHTLDSLDGRRIFVAARGGDAVVGFLVASPIPARQGYLFEQIVRHPQNAPNGTAEMLVDHAMQAAAADNWHYVTLGMVPLSRRLEMVSSFPNPPWLRLALFWLRAHGRRFWNFDGLENFKAKFHPDSWEPVFAISREPRFSPSTLLAIARAFTDRPLPGALPGVLLNAALQEMRWLRERISPGSARQKNTDSVFRPLV